MSDSSVTVCNVPGCKCKVEQVFKAAAVNLNFEGSYNSTRK
ncbi:hypothetical protein [Clostridium estertheticum]|nr:hypothetical protein [Clostridium estertheticum]